MKMRSSRKANAQLLTGTIDVMMESLKAQTTACGVSTKQYVEKPQSRRLHKAAACCFCRRGHLRLFLSNPQVPPHSSAVRARPKLASRGRPFRAFPASPNQCRSSAIGEGAETVFRRSAKWFEIVVRSHCS